jgi:2-haloacid dehalogenase
MPRSLPDLVLFDVGNVLVQLTPFSEALRDNGCLETRSALEALERLRASELASRFHLGLATVDEFYSAVRRAAACPLDDETIRALYLGFLGPPMPGMEELIAELTARGVRAAGLSDTTPIHLEALVSYPAVARLERLVASCDIGFAKPSPQAFAAALRLVGAAPSRTLFVDDLPANVAGAREAGLRAVVFQGAAALRREIGLEG